MSDSAFHVLQNKLLNRFGQCPAVCVDDVDRQLNTRREDAIFTLREVCRYLATKGLSYLEWEIECAERTLKGWERSSQEAPRAKLPLTNDCGVWCMPSSDTKKQPSEILESLAPVIAGVLGAYLSRPTPSTTVIASSLDTFEGIYEAIDEARKRKDDKVETALLRRLIRLIEAPIAEAALAPSPNDSPCCATTASSALPPGFMNFSDWISEQRSAEAAQGPVRTPPTPSDPPAP